MGYRLPDNKKTKPEVHKGEGMKRIRATEIVLFACLLLSCFTVPRFVTSQLLSGIGHLGYGTYDYEKFYSTFPEGGLFEQLVRIGLIGLTVFYAFRIAKRIDQGRGLGDQKAEKGGKP
jgi:hypothetical protein